MTKPIRNTGPCFHYQRSKYYNQYHPQCEVCPRYHGKMVKSLRGEEQKAGSGHLFLLDKLASYEHSLCFPCCRFIPVLLFRGIYDVSF